MQFIPYQLATYNYTKMVWGILKSCSNICHHLLQMIVTCTPERTTVYVQFTDGAQLYVRGD